MRRRSFTTSKCVVQNLDFKKLFAKLKTVNGTHSAETVDETVVIKLMCGHIIMK